MLSLFGAVIGMQLLTTLGVTPNTTLIGVLITVIVSRIPVSAFLPLRSVHMQNMAQTAISSATFGAANGMLLPIAIPYLYGSEQLILPLLCGLGAAILLDAWLLYRLFNSRVFPAAGAWPPGVAAAQAIRAAQGDGHVFLLGLGVAVAAGGAWLAGIPMAAFGTAFIGNVWALSLFGCGLLVRNYGAPFSGIDINAMYLPHGVMIGAGLVALVQVFNQVRRPSAAASVDPGRETVTTTQVRFVLGSAGLAYLAIAVFLAVGCGLYVQMGLAQLIGFVLYSAAAAYAHCVIVGVAAMHSGWFPAFAVALITLIVGLVLGFPPVALVVLCAYSVATGPAAADMGFDLKAGHILRGNGSDPRLEEAGRRQQYMASSLGLCVAILVVALVHKVYFSHGLVPPVAKVYLATITAGVADGVATKLVAWAVVGATVQWIGGPKRQMGVMLATGLLIANGLAGVAVGLGILVRLLAQRLPGNEVRGKLEVFAAGAIAGDAIYGFLASAVQSLRFWR